MPDFKAEKVALQYARDARKLSRHFIYMRDLIYNTDYLPRQATQGPFRIAKYICPPRLARAY